MAAAVCRIRPDVPALDRAFDYEVPEALVGLIRVGTIVRVELHGRRVRGWVVATDVAAEAEDLRRVQKASSAGPPAQIMALCDWVAWRWAGPPALVLRSASPPNVVDPGLRFGPVEAGPGFSAELLAWPPAADRRELVISRLASAGSTLVIVPGAARAASFADELERDGRVVAPFTAGQSAAARSRSWSIAARGGCVVVGGRVGVLSPLPDLAAVVVLDEGDEALTEERAPTWSAREVAVTRARRSGASITLITPTPTVEALTLVPHVTRPDRETERRGWAQIEIVDPREEQPGRQLLTDRLLAAIRAELGADRRVVCILNRKGRARLLVCDDCGSVARCERCGAAVVEADVGLGCERCGTNRPRICADCHHTVLRSRRLGVSRVRDELGALLPDVAIGAIDAAGTDHADAAIVVGTEAALHRLRPRFGMVAFLEFDQELLAPRYRALEQAMWLLVRASRLVGGRRGRVLVQSRVGDHEVLTAAREAEPARVAETERRRRAQLAFPPFGGLAELSGHPEAVATAAELIEAAGAEMLGPEGSRALVRATTPEVLADLLATVDLERARARGRLRVEVDPLRA